MKLSLESTENHSSNEPVILDADAKATALKKVQSAYHALSFLNEMITKDSLTKSIRYNTLSVASHDIKDLIKSLGGDEDLKQEDDLRLKNLQRANAEVHRLTAELGKGITKEGVSVKIGQMCQEVEEWWKSLGFGYSKGTISGWRNGSSMTFEFNCHIDMFMSTMEEKPISKKAKLKERQEEMGKELILIPEQRGSDMMVTLDCPENRQWIVNKLKERFPSIRFHKWESHFIHGSEDFQITSLHANFPVEEI